MRLIIGNKRYSSWSLRGWLALKTAGLAFEEILIDIYADDAKERLKEISPSGLVPALFDGEVAVWDSLAIAEYAHEKTPKAGLWPVDAAKRAWARSVAAEMHAGFADLRREMPMDLARREVKTDMSDAVRDQIARIAQVWNECRAAHAAEGPYLFGGWTIADVMYAPVVTRFQSYGVVLEGAAADYAVAVLAHPAMREWAAEV